MHGVADTRSQTSGLGALQRAAGGLRQLLDLERLLIVTALLQIDTQHPLRLPRQQCAHRMQAIDQLNLRAQGRSILPPV
jgi:hypothetical protein